MCLFVIIMELEPPQMYKPSPLIPQDDRLGGVHQAIIEIHLMTFSVLCDVIKLASIPNFV